MADEKFELTRRKALAGLGTIGAASAGAGMGTSAFFNDTETFEGNTLQAGELDIEVDLTGSVDQDGLGPDEDDWYSEEMDGDGGVIGVSFNISDLKPGDTYNFCWCIKSFANPAVVRAYIPWDSVSYGNSSTADDAADLPGVNSVDDFENLLGSEDITVSKNLYVCEGGVDKEENILENDITYEPDDSDTYDWDGGLGNWVTSLSDNTYTSQDGVPIGSHDGVGSKVDGDLDTGTSDYILLGTQNGAHFEAVAYCMTIDVSEDAGNELQKASAGFDLQFRAEQARHNDHPFDDLATRPRTDSPKDWDDDYPF